MNISITNDSALSLEDLYYFQTSVLTGIVSNAINLIVGLPTNLYVLWLIVTGPGGLVASDFFTLNLAVTEVIYCPSNVVSLIFYHTFNRRLIEAARFFLGFVVFGRPLFMCSVCVERYLAVVHPVVFLRYRPLRYRVFCSGLVWLIVLGLSLSYEFVGLRYRTYITMNHYLVMISVMSFCCLSVLRALKRPGPGEGDREREGMNDTKLRAFKIILFITVSVLATYIPVIVLVIMYFQEYISFNIAYTIGLAIIVVAGFVQPLLYLQRAGKLPCIRGF